MEPHSPSVMEMSSSAFFPDVLHLVKPNTSPEKGERPPSNAKVNTFAEYQGEDETASPMAKVNGLTQLQEQGRGGTVASSMVIVSASTQHQEGEEEREEEDGEPKTPPDNGDGKALAIFASQREAAEEECDEEEKRRRRRRRIGSQPGRINWNFRETVVLLDAKLRDSEEHGTNLGRAGVGGRYPNNMERWDRIADFCLAHGVTKTGNQCSNRWDKLWPRFKKLFDYEATKVFEIDSYWRMPLHIKVRMGLPESFNREIFQAMAERFGSERAAKIAGMARANVNTNSAVEKVLSASTLIEGNKEMEAPPPPFDGADEPLAGKKRTRDPESHGKDNTSSTDQVFQMYEKMENSRQKCYERILEDVTTMVRDRVAADNQTTSVICSSLNRIADALNNIAAMVAKK